MRYSEEIIEEVRSANNIVDVVGAVVKLKRSGANYFGLCPFHNEKSGSFSVSESKQMYYCFGCHASGNVLTFVMSYYQSGFPEALQMLADRAGIRLPEKTRSAGEKEASDKRQELFEINKQAAAYFNYLLKQENGRAGLEYLRKRQLSEETIRHFALGYADKYANDLYRYLKKKGWSDERLGESGLFVYHEKNGYTDKFWNRVMFPIADERGRIIGFGGRVLGDGKPKYLNSPETKLFNKGEHLFALNYARTSHEKYLILCEGYMDVISMHQAGFTNAVASLGTALTPHQARKLGRYTREIRLLYDSDEAGIKAALRAIPILKAAGLNSRVVNMKPYKDPDEFINGEGTEAFRQRLESAEDGFMFKIRQKASESDLDDPQGMTRFQHGVGAMLLEIEDELERENYLKACALKYHIPEDGLRRLIGRLSVSGTPAENYQPPKKTGTPADKEDHSRLSQKLMLTYLVNYPEAFELTETYIGPDDFQDPLCREIAGKLYEQKKKGDIKEAALLNAFTDPEVQQEIAGFFHTEIRVNSENEQNRAFTDTVLRLMQQSNEARIKSWDGKDMLVLAELMNCKKNIEQMMRGDFFFHLHGGLKPAEAGLKK